MHNIQRRSQSEGPNTLDTTNFVKLLSPYLIGEYSVINEGKENFTKFLVSRAFGYLPGYATDNIGYPANKTRYFEIKFLQNKDL